MIFPENRYPRFRIMLQSMIFLFFLNAVLAQWP